MDWLLYGYFLSIVLEKKARASKRGKTHAVRSGTLRKPADFIGLNRPFPLVVKAG